MQFGDIARENKEIRAICPDLRWFIRKNDRLDIKK
jgi:hypothetical protein